MPESPAAFASPAWESISHDVLCPLCDYNLRGLTEPRCPECGYRFEWAVVTDPTARLHPYLFEHHPERNVRSFFRTHWGTLRPIRFWSSLSPTQPSRPKRLVLYGFFSSLVIVLALAGQWVAAMFDEWGYLSGSMYYFTNRRFAATQTASSLSFADWWNLAKDAWNSNRDFRDVQYCILFWVLWPWLTLLILSIFGASMSKAKVKMIHVMRCLAYTFDLGLWLGLYFGAAGFLSIYFAKDPASNSGLSMILIGIVPFVVFARLWMAFRFYLRFDHAFWTILASQVIVFLIVLNFVALPRH